VTGLASDIKKDWQAFR